MSDSTLARMRLLSGDLLAEELEPDGDSGPLATAHKALEAHGLDIGVWEAGPGADTDVEVDEVFLILSGLGTVTFEDGSSIDLRPGVLVRLGAGDRTTWTVSERLRKLYLAGGTPPLAPAQ